MSGVLHLIQNWFGQPVLSGPHVPFAWLSPNEPPAGHQGWIATFAPPVTGKQYKPKGAHSEYTGDSLKRKLGTKIVKPWAKDYDSVAALTAVRVPEFIIYRPEQAVPRWILEIETVGKPPARPCSIM